jgi:hypothetical protein
MARAKHVLSKAEGAQRRKVRKRIAHHEVIHELTLAHRP